MNRTDILLFFDLRRLNGIETFVKRKGIRYILVFPDDLLCFVGACSHKRGGFYFTLLKVKTISYENQIYF